MCGGCGAACVLSMLSLQLSLQLPTYVVLRIRGDRRRKKTDFSELEGNFNGTGSQGGNLCSERLRPSKHGCLGTKHTSRHLPTYTLTVISGMGSPTDKDQQTD